MRLIPIKQHSLPALDLRLVVWHQTFRFPGCSWSLTRVSHLRPDLQDALEL